MAGELKNSNTCFGFFSSGGGGGGGGASGIWGISDATGTYTYYDTIALANADASSGDTIELFANVRETSAVEWVLKDGVIYNMNGYTYTLDVATTEDAVTDNNVAGNFRILNGTIRRRGGTASQTNSLALFIDNTSSLLTLEGVEFNSDFGTTAVLQADVIGGVFTHDVVGFVFQARNINHQGGTLKNVQAISNSMYGIYLNSSCTLINCYAYSGGTSAIFSNNSSNTLIDCTAETDAQYGFYANNAETLINCIGISTASAGIYSRGSLINCQGVGLSGVGIQYQPNGTGRAMQGCVAYSKTSVALSSPSDFCVVKNCTAIAFTNVAVQGRGEFYDCVFESLLNSGGGASMLITGTTTISGCTLRVNNSSAYCITALSAYNSNILQNVYVNATTPVNTTNITNTQTNTQDTFGNITEG
jgi:hypothetical protein